MALAAPCAAGAIGVPAGVEYRPAPLSAMSTRPDLRFVVARWVVGNQTHTLLAHQPGTGGPQPVAHVVQHDHDGDPWAWVRPLPLQADPAPPGDLELAVLEQLFVMVFRLNPLARYCVEPVDAQDRPDCGAPGQGLTQGRALQMLAAWREPLAARTPAAVPWRLVEIGPAPRPALDVDTVGVRVVGPGDAIARQPVHFNRAPHSICMARIDDQGLASCRLEDQHGDGAQHSHASSVVASFPGELRPDRVLLPTTYVLPAPPTAPAPPAFARPLTLPSGWPAAFSPPPPAPAAPGSPAPAR